MTLGDGEVAWDSYGGGSGVQAVSTVTLITHENLMIASLVRFEVNLSCMQPTVREFMVWTSWL